MVLPSVVFIEVLADSISSTYGCCGTCVWNADPLTNLLLQALIDRLPGYVSIQMVRFFFKEKENINAKILKVQ